MQIKCISMWTQNLEGMKYFYVKFFGAEAGALYNNEKAGFECYLLTFKRGLVVELMRRADVKTRPVRPYIGITGLAFKAGTMKEVRRITEKLQKENVPVLKEPRISGDGFFSSTVADPDGNEIEIAVDIKPRASGK